MNYSPPPFTSLRIPPTFGQSQDLRYLEGRLYHMNAIIFTMLGNLRLSFMRISKLNISEKDIIRARPGLRFSSSSDLEEESLGPGKKSFCYFLWLLKVSTTYSTFDFWEFLLFLLCRANLFSPAPSLLHDAISAVYEKHPDKFYEVRSTSRPPLLRVFPTFLFS